MERERELAVLRGALGHARDGHGSLVVIDANQGLGKSALVDAAAGFASELGMEVLRARGRELERHYAFGGAMQLFAQRLADARPAERARLLSGAAELAEPVLEAGGASPDSTGEDEGQAYSILHGLHWLCQNLAEGTGAAVIVDDAAMIDEPTQRFLHYLVERIVELPVALIITRHPVEPTPGPPPLAAFDVMPATRTIRPEPLSPDGVARVVRAALPTAGDDLVWACMTATGGIPFLVHELISAIESDPDPVTPERVPLYGPATVARSVITRLSRLTFGAAALARAVAVLGDGIHLRHAAELAGIEPAMAPRVADSLAAVGILRVEQTLAFVHPLVRAAVHNELPTAERAYMHLEAARLLHEAGEAADLVALHLLDAQPSGSAWATECLREAARAAIVRGAPASAMRLLRRALEEPPARHERGSILVELGRAEAAAGDRSAIVHLEQGLVLTGEPAARAHVELSIGRLLAAQGDHPGAVAAFGRGLDVVESADVIPGSDRELVAQLTASMLTASRFVVSDHPLVRARFAAELQDPGRGDTVAERLLLAQAAVERALSGSAASEVAELALRAVSQDGLDEGPTGRAAALSAAQALTWAGDLDAAFALLDAEIALAEECGMVHDYATACHHRALVHIAAGNVADAVVDAQVALDGRRFGWRLAFPRTCAALAVMLVERGELPAAHEALALAGARADWLDHASWTDLVAARARVALADGRPADALNDYLECGLRQDEFGAPNPAVMAWRSGAATAALRLSDRETATHLAGEELDLACAFGAAPATGVALRTSGEVAGGSAGVALLEASVEILDGSGAELELAYSQVALGGMLRRANRRAAAREPLRIGLDLARRCGSAALALRARDELVAAGGRPRREALSGIEALTPSERRTAELGADGLTNREIAETLFVTVKTVEWHLRNAYAKLEITSRSELSEAMRAGVAA
jgi:DNA-binding CsgD family transcriptional regulator